MRIGEAFGLSWEQINFSRQEITVSQQLDFNGKTIGPTKNRQSRTFPVSDWVMKIIFEVQERQKQFRKEFFEDKHVLGHADISTTIKYIYLI